MKAFSIVFIATFLVACASTTESPNGWVTLDGKPSDPVLAQSAIEKCDYIRAKRTAVVDADAKSAGQLLLARMCMEKEGFKVKK